MEGGIWRGSFDKGKLVLPWEDSVRKKYLSAKRALELLGVEHDVILDNVVLHSDAKSFLVNLGLSWYVSQS